MATNESMVAGKMRGVLGKELVFRQWSGKTIVSKAPKSRKGDPSPAQADVQEKFLLASRYARSVMQGTDLGMKEAYSAALRPRQNLYSRALEDFLSPPVIKRIRTTDYTGQPGSFIAVRATDDFRVTTVQVEIYAAGGALLEKGNAVQQVNGLDWTYTATQANSLLAGSRIRAIVTDVPGNEGTAELTLS